MLGVQSVKNDVFNGVKNNLHILRIYIVAGEDRVDFFELLLGAFAPRLHIPCFSYLEHLSKSLFCGRNALILSVHTIFHLSHFKIFASARNTLRKVKLRFDQSEDFSTAWANTEEFLHATDRLD